MKQTDFRPRRIADNPAVFVKSGDIETALRVLNRRVQKCGGLKALKIRRKYPSRKARRRAKARRAAQRFHARQHGKV